MRTLRLSLAGSVILALLGGLGWRGAWPSHDESDMMTFPTGYATSPGTFDDVWVEFIEDGTIPRFAGVLAGRLPLSGGASPW